MQREHSVSVRRYDLSTSVLYTAEFLPELSDAPEFESEPAPEPIAKQVNKSIVEASKAI